MQKPTEKGLLESVRNRARNHNQVRLSRNSGDERDVSNSLQKIRTLKSLEGEVRDELDRPIEDVNIFARLWDWFQRTIGNR